MRVIRSATLDRTVDGCRHLMMLVGLFSEPHAFDRVPKMPVARHQPGLRLILDVVGDPRWPCTARLVGRGCGHSVGSWHTRAGALFRDDGSSAKFP